MIWATWLVGLLALGGYASPLVARGLKRVEWPAGAVLGLLANAALVGLVAVDGGLTSVQGGLFLLALAFGGAARLCRRWPRFEVVALVVIAQAAALIPAGLISPAHAGDAPAGPWVAVHVGLMLAGFVCFGVSFACSVLYLFERGRLKARQLDNIRALPALDTLDHVNTRAMVAGFLTLTCGMGMGLLRAHEQDPGTLGGFTVWAMSAMWLWYAAGLQARLVGGHRGVLGAWFGVVGMTGLVVVLMVLGFVERAFHGGWTG